MQRFTIWMNAKEREALRQMAEEYGTSQNYIVRVALREALGIEAPDTQKAWQKVTSPGPPRVVGPFGE